MNLYFDIGNTNIKLNFSIDGNEYYFNYETESTKSVDTFFLQLPKEVKENNVDNIYICSVVPPVEEVVKGAIKKYMQIDPIMVRYPIKTGIKLNVDHPQSIGADLVALAAYATSRSEKGIIVNVGTATTIVTVENKTLQGVLICPGLMTAFNSLISKASKLGQTNLKPDTKYPYGKNTEDALSLGVLKGHAKMIDGLVSDIEDGHKLYISGGLAKKILPFSDKYEFVKEATIQGVKVIEALNIK